MTNKELEVIQDRFIALTDGVTFQREASFAIQLINKSEQLKKCSKESLIGAVLNIANTGLTLNPVLKLAYIVPRWNRSAQGNEACLEPSYQGLVKLLTDTGSVTSITANVVYEKDEFSYELGTNQTVKHVQKLGNKGSIIGAYAVATLHNGVKMVEVMDINEILSIRDTSESYKAYKDGKIKSCVWVDFEGEMIRKTVLRRIVKYLPKTEMWDKLANAINLDEQDFKCTDGQISFIENLLSTSAFDDDFKERVEREMFNYSSIEANKMITMLQNNQINPILAGHNYSQTDIKNHLNKTI
jgi:recombination protein RecT